MAKKFSLGIVRKFAVLALLILCIAPLVLSTLLFPTVIRDMIVSYLEDMVVKLPKDAQIVVYNGGLVYWSNNMLHLRRFGEPRYHIYRTYHLDKIARRAIVDSNRVPLLGSISDYHPEKIRAKGLAVSNDAGTVVVNLPPNAGTYVIRNMETRKFEDPYSFSMATSGDGRRILTRKEGCGDCCGMRRCSYGIAGVGILYFVLVCALSFILHEDTGDLGSAACFTIGAVYFLRAILLWPFGEQDRYEVYDLDDCLPFPIEQVLVENGHQLLEEFGVPPVNRRGASTLSDNSQRAIGSIQQPGDNYGDSVLTSIRVDGFERVPPRRTIMSSMDRRTMVSVEKVRDGRIVTLLPSCRAFTSLFELD